MFLQRASSLTSLFSIFLSKCHFTVGQASNRGLFFTLYKIITDIQYTVLPPSYNLVIGPCGLLYRSCIKSWTQFWKFTQVSFLLEWHYRKQPFLWRTAIRRSCWRTGSPVTLNRRSSQKDGPQQWWLPASSTWHYCILLVSIYWNAMA